MRIVHVRSSRDGGDGSARYRPYSSAGVAGYEVRAMGGGDFTSEELAVLHALDFDTPKVDGEIVLPTEDDYFRTISVADAVEAMRLLHRAVFQEGMDAKYTTVEPVALMFGWTTEQAVVFAEELDMEPDDFEFPD